MLPNRCLICYEYLGGGEGLYHEKCSRKFFGSPQPPELPYSRKEMADLAGQIIRQSTTVTGVQSKISLDLQRRKGKANRLTLVGLWGSYILKPPADQYRQMPENEDLTMHLATLFGIETVPHCLIKLQSGELAYITVRIDRTKKKEKIAMEDMCQLSGRLTEDKYKASMEVVGKTLKQISANPMLDALTLFEISVFCFLTGNADMHLKNFSLYNNPAGMTVLAPAYDLLSTRLLIPENKDPEEMALTLNGKKRNFTLNDFKAFASNLGLNEKQMVNSLDKFGQNMAKALQWIERGFLTQEKTHEYMELLKTRADRLKL